MADSSLDRSAASSVAGVSQDPSIHHITDEIRREQPLLCRRNALSTRRSVNARSVNATLRRELVGAVAPRPAPGRWSPRPGQCRRQRRSAPPRTHQNRHMPSLPHPAYTSLPVPSPRVQPRTGWGPPWRRPSHASSRRWDRFVGSAFQIDSLHRLVSVAGTPGFRRYHHCYTRDRTGGLMLPLPPACCHSINRRRQHREIRSLESAGTTAISLLIMTHRTDVRSRFHPSKPRSRLFATAVGKAPEAVLSAARSAGKPPW